MNIHEYQAKELLQKFGAATPRGKVATTPEEAEAIARGCVQVVLATHSFQAPAFYERMGYERKYTIEGRPKGYSDIIYVKSLEQGVVLKR